MLVGSGIFHLLELFSLDVSPYSARNGGPLSRLQAIDQMCSSWPVHSLTECTPFDLNRNSICAARTSACQTQAKHTNSSHLFFPCNPLSLAASFFLALISPLTFALVRAPSCSFIGSFTYLLRSFGSRQKHIALQTTTMIMMRCGFSFDL